MRAYAEGDIGSGRTSILPVATSGRLGLLVRIGRRLYRRPTSALGASVVLLFVLTALLGPWVAPYSPTEQFFADRLQAPSWEHPFGTDRLGRDVLSRVILGTRSILALAGLGTLVAVLLGTLLGLLSGYRGGRFDEVLMRFFDSLLAIPALLLALLLLGTIGPSRQSVLLVIAVVYTPIVARVVRSETLSVKTKDFVEAARLQGEPTLYILLREILPSVMPALSVEGALRFSYAIFLVASLGFLGVGVQPPTPDWGLMVKESRDFAGLAPWTLLFPAGAISLLVVGMNLLADGFKRVLQSPEALGVDESARLQRSPRRRREPASGPRNPSRGRPGRGPQTGSLLVLENVTVSYEQGGLALDAVRDVSLAIEPGQTYGLVGESGSGKTTLALALMRYLPPNGAVRQGRIAFGDRDLSTLSDEELRTIWGSQINFVPQDPAASLNPSLRVGEQIAEALREHKGLSASQADRRVVELLRDVHIADPKRIAQSYPHQLSGGMQQRVMIATALSTSPRLLVLDEPTTGLDVTTEAAVLDLIDELIHERETSMLYISHDLGVVARVADRVAVLYAGELVEDAATRELFERPLHPYTRGLLDSVPRLGESKSAIRLSSMRGWIPSASELPRGCVFAPRCPLAVERCRRERPPLEGASPHGEGRRRIRCHRWREIRRGEIDARTTAAPPGPAGRSQPERDRGAEPALAIARLRAHFRLRRPLGELLRGRWARVLKAVDGVSMSVERGRTLGLVGESGSGKTTLVRAVLGLVERADGRIELSGRELPEQLSERDLETLTRLQLVAQNPEEALNPYLTIGEILRRPLLRLRGRSRREAEEEARRLLELVRLGPEYMPRLPTQLSGGEKQRVAIARAFAVGPELVLCDEPTSALDVSVQARILNLLVDLQRERGGAYLFISHDLTVVGYLADELAVIYLGRLMEVGRTETFFEPPYHPYTEALLSSVPLLDPDVRAERIRLEGEVPSPTEVPTGCPFHTRCPRLLGDICVQEEPPWRETDDGRRIYCHIPLEELVRLQTPFGARRTRER